MKLFIVSCLLSTMFVLFPVRSGHCDFFEGFQRGWAIGEAINRDIAIRKLNRGYQKQNVFVDKHYNFSKLKNIFVQVGFVKNAIIDDNHVAKQYLYDIEDAFNKKPVRLMTLHSIQNEIINIYPDYIYLSDMDKKFFIQNYINENIDATLRVYIYEYNEDFTSSNVSLTYNVVDRYGKEIFNYDDDRLSVRNQSKEKLLKKITDKFIEEFLKQY